MAKNSFHSYQVIDEKRYCPDHAVCYFSCMRKAQQLRFFDDFNKSFAHGGELSIGKRKTRRPITTKKAMHVTLRSSHANGTRSFLKKENAQFVKFLLLQISKKHNVRVYRYAINGNHLHLLIKGKTREGIQNFFRVFSGQIAERVTKTCRGNAFSGKFWDHLIFSRIVEWGRDFLGVQKYVLQNTLEAIGAIAYTPRKKYGDLRRGEAASGSPLPTNSL